MTKRVAYNFQQDGIKILLNGLLNGKINDIPTRSMLLYDEMGMGKTIQALETMRLLNVSPILIVCPSQCVEVWKGEIKKFFQDVYDDVRVFIGNGVSRSTMLKLGPKTLFITSYDTLRNQYKYYIEKSLDVGKLNVHEMERYCLVNRKSLDRVLGLTGDDLKRELLIIAQSIKRKIIKQGLGTLCSPFIQQEWGCIILDEVHKIKTTTSSTTKAVGFLNSKYRLALSGTPIMNSAFDLFSILQFGLGLFKIDWTSVKNNPNSEHCRSILEMVCFGRTKEEVPELFCNLPKRKKEDEHVILPWTDEDQVSNYCEIKNYVIGSNTNTSWGYIQRLREICLHKDLPGFLHEDFKKTYVHYRWSRATHHTFNTWIRKRVFTLLCCFRRLGGFNWDVQEHIISKFVERDVQCCIQPSIKMIYVYELTKTYDKIVIYCTFKVFLESLMIPWLDQINIQSIIHKGGSKADQKKALSEFHKDSNVKILLIVKQSGVEGLNLQFTSHVCVVMDPHFNEAVDEQAVSRIYRIGQEKGEVIIRKLYMKGSIDEALRIMQEKKGNVSNVWTSKKKNNLLTMENQKLFLQKYDKVNKIK
jgi:SNF2 family DNA or RNA helicase